MSIVRWNLRPVIFGVELSRWLKISGLWGAGEFSSHTCEDASFLNTLFGIPPAPYRSLPGPSGPKSPKSLRKSLPGPEPRGPKSVQNSLERVSGVSKQLFWVSDSFETVLDTFWTLRTLFRRLFGISGPKGPGESYTGQAGSQHITLVAFLVTSGSKDTPACTFSELAPARLALLQRFACLVHAPTY